MADTAQESFEEVDMELAKCSLLVGGYLALKKSLSAKIASTVDGEEKEALKKELEEAETAFDAELQRYKVLRLEVQKLAIEAVKLSPQEELELNAAFTAAAERSMLQ